MNEETLLASEETTDPTGEPTTSPTEIQDISDSDWPVTEVTYPEEFYTEDMGDESNATYPEDILGDAYQETTAETVAPVTVEVIESAAYDISHSVLFSGFLVCGTLIGISLLRKIYGT